MSFLARWIQQQAACYGAAIAIILEQLNAYPRTTLPENPNPLVRIQDAGFDQNDWHADELITRHGARYVLVWDAEEIPGQAPAARLLSN